MSEFVYVYHPYPYLGFRPIESRPSRCCNRSPHMELSYVYLSVFYVVVRVDFAHQNDTKQIDNRVNVFV